MQIQAVAAFAAAAALSAAAQAAEQPPLQVAYAGDTQMTCEQIATSIAKMDVIAITHGQAAAQAEVAKTRPRKSSAEDEAAAARVQTAHMRRLFLTGLFEGRCRPVPVATTAGAGAAIIDPPAAAAKPAGGR